MSTRRCASRPGSCSSTKAALSRTARRRRCSRTRPTSAWPISSAAARRACACSPCAASATRCGRGRRMDRGRGKRRCRRSPPTRRCAKRSRCASRARWSGWWSSTTSAGRWACCMPSTCCACTMTRMRDPLLWTGTALVALALFMTRLEPLFAAAYPRLDRPMYRQQSFAELTLEHLALVAASSAVSLGVGVAIGVFGTRRAGREFRPMLESVVAIAQTVPPVAVLAIAAPLIGYGALPALIALALYGLLPIVQATTSGLDAVEPSVREAADGLGMSARQALWQIELPLASPVIAAGVRTSVAINIGTAAVASTVGAPTLGTPIIVGLAGFNTAYVLQGAVLSGLLAVVVDQALGRLPGLRGRRG